MGGKTIVRDLTSGSVAGQLLWFGMPLFFSGLLQTTYNMVDMMVVGHYIGKNGLSAVSVAGEVLNFLTFVAMGLSNAGQIILAQYVGAGRKADIGKIIGTLFSVLLFCSAALTALCIALREPILAWLNTPPEIWDEAWDYLTVCCAGLVFTYGYNLLSAILRGLGDSKHPLLFIAIASLCNVVLDLFFIAGLHMGVEGAALATVIGQAVSVLYAMLFLLTRREKIGFSLSPGDFRVDGVQLASLIRLGVPMMLQTAAVTFSKLVITAWINPFGSVVLSVTAIGNKVITLTNVFSQAFSTAGGAMIAQSIGAEKYSRVPRVIGIALAMDLAIAAVFAWVTLAAPEAVFGLFTSDAQVLSMARAFLGPAVLLYLGCGIRPPMSALINGSGNARLNLAVALLDGIVARIALAYILCFPLGWGYLGCWYGNAIAGTVPFFLGGAYFLSGKWRTRRYLIKD